jgi:hypothetical protein
VLGVGLVRKAGEDVAAAAAATCCRDAIVEKCRPDAVSTRVSATEVSNKQNPRKSMDISLHHRRTGALKSRPPLMSTSSLVGQKVEHQPCCIHGQLHKQHEYDALQIHLAVG